jgi:hypothetical protein
MQPLYHIKLPLYIVLCMCVFCCWQHDGERRCYPPNERARDSIIYLVNRATSPAPNQPGRGHAFKVVHCQRELAQNRSFV